MDNCKELMTKFKALTEEEQKDLLFVLLDCMDFYDGKLHSSSMTPTS